MLDTFMLKAAALRYAVGVDAGNGIEPCYRLARIVLVTLTARRTVLFRDFRQGYLESTWRSISS